MPHLQLLLWVALAAVTGAQYSLDSSFYGLDFFDNFDFYTNPDPTLGFVQYVNRTFANETGMLATSDTQAAWGVDNTGVFDASAAFGRYSVRLTSNKSWTHGLFVLNLAHMPSNQCGVWPAFWTLGTAPDFAETWPTSGEIDIIEYANTGALNQMTLHTSADKTCTIAGSDQTGTLLTNNCSISAPDGGCSISAVDAAMEGNDFNADKGGFYAMEWISSGIKIWYWPAGAVPSDLESRDGSVPDPSRWATPTANFQGDCDFDARFFNHSIVFDTTFCGTYAGNTFATDSCPLLDPSNGWTSCNEFVANNPQAFVDAYWQVNWLNVYTTPAIAAPTTTSSKSSIAPALSTSAVSTMPVPGMGQKTTPLLSLLVTSSPVAPNSLPPASAMSTSSVATLAARAKLFSDVAGSSREEDGTYHGFLESRTPGETPPGCRELPPGPVPAPDPLPHCKSASNSSIANSVREAEPQTGGVSGGSTSFCSVAGMGCNRASNNTTKRSPEPQVDGGSVGLCSVPGMDCDKHYKADGVAQRDTQPQIGATEVMPRQHTEILEASFWVPEQTLVIGIESNAGAIELLRRTARIESTEGYLRVPEPTVLPVIGPRAAYVESAEASLWVPHSSLLPGIEPDGIVILPRTAQIESTEADLLFTIPTLPPRTLPGGDNDDSIGTMPRATKSVVTSVIVERQEMETGPNAETSEMLSPLQITATCVPALVHAPEGGLTASGCLLPSGVSPTTAIPFEAANTTTTLSGTVMHETPRLSNGALVLSQLSRDAEKSAGYSVEVKTYTVVAAVVAVVDLLSLWSNGVL